MACWFVPMCPISFKICRGHLLMTTIHHDKFHEDWLSIVACRGQKKIWWKIQNGRHFQRFSIGRNFACNDSIFFKFGMYHPLITDNHHCKFHDDLLKTFWRRPKYLGNGASNRKMPWNKSCRKCNFPYWICCQIWSISFGLVAITKKLYTTKWPVASFV